MDLKVERNLASFLLLNYYFDLQENPAHLLSVIHEDQIYQIHSVFNLNCSHDRYRCLNSKTDLAIVTLPDLVVG